MVLDRVRRALRDAGRVDRGDVLTVGQYLFGLAAFAWVLQQIDWRQAVDLLSGVDAGLLALLGIVLVAELLSHFYTLHVLLNELQPTPFLAAVNIDLVVRFINHLLPSRLAGRSATPLAVEQFTDIDWSGAIAVAGVYTANHAILYGIVALGGLAFAYAALPIGLTLVILLSIGLYFAAGATLLFAGRRMRVLNLFVTYLTASLGRVPVVGDRLAALFGKIPEYTGESETVFRRLTESPFVWVAYTLGWSGRIAVFPAIRVWLLLGVFDAQGVVPLALLPLYLVMAYSVTLLPLTPGGVGVAEATATLVFVSLGLPEGVVASVIVVDRFLGVYLPTLFGWIPMSRIDLGTASAE